jgi:predicted nucleic acid-binding protein
MKLAITDANVFIDLLYLELLPHLFEVGYSIYTTQEVFDELLETQQEALNLFLVEKKLIIYCFNAKEYAELIQFKVSNRLSYTDHSVLFLAERLNAIVVTGDNLLRKLCEKRQLTVHGILWLFDQFVDKKCLTPNDAAQVLRKLIAYNRRLPKQESQQRIRDWELTTPIQTLETPSSHSNTPDLS